MKIKTLAIALLLVTLAGQSHAHEEQAALSNVLIGQLAQRVNDLEKQFNSYKQEGLMITEHNFAHRRLMEAHIFHLLATLNSHLPDLPDCIPQEKFKPLFQGLEDAALAYVAASKKWG